MAKSVEFIGAEKLFRMYAKWQGTPLADALKQAVFMTGQEALNRSKEYVPVDLGVLRNSGNVETPVMSAEKIEVTLSYGGAAAPYALIVHEDMRPKNWSKPGTGPKYLERAVVELAPRFLRKIQARFASYVRRAG